MTQHGLGRLKLLREHVKNDLGDEPSGEATEMLKALDDQVNAERLDMS
jgi:hypothetical protein